MEVSDAVEIVVLDSRKLSTAEIALKVEKSSTFGSVGYAVAGGFSDGYADNGELSVYYSKSPLGACIVVASSLESAIEKAHANGHYYVKDMQTLDTSKPNFVSIMQSHS